MRFASFENPRSTKMVLSRRKLEPSLNHRMNPSIFFSRLLFFLKHALIYLLPPPYKQHQHFACTPPSFSLLCALVLFCVCRRNFAQDQPGYGGLGDDDDDLPPPSASAFFFLVGWGGGCRVYMHTQEHTHTHTNTHTHSLSHTETYTRARAHTHTHTDIHTHTNV